MSTAPTYVVAWSPTSILLAFTALAPDASLGLAVLHAAMPWLLLVNLLAVGALAGLRRARLPLLAALAAAGWAWWPGVGAVSTSPPTLRVMTANLLFVNAAPERLMDELLAGSPDVLILTEYTPDWEDRWPDDVLPYRVEWPATHSFGIAVLSARPLRDAVVEDLEGVPMVRAWVEVAPGEVVEVVGVHAEPPRTVELTAHWHRQLRALGQRTGGEHPVVVAGDLNASWTHPSFRALVAGGLVDALAAVGHGTLTTWPRYARVPSLLRLDHVLVRGLEPVAGGRLEGHGSDHHPVWVDLALP